MEKTKILIIEDEILIAEDLKDILISFGIHPNNIKLAHDKETGFKLLKDYQPNIALLDIRMENEVDGLEIGKYLSINSTINFIYITAHADVSMIKKIIETQPAGYITKPFKKSDLYANISLIISKQKDSNKKVIKIKEGYTHNFIPQENIIYIQSDGNYINIITTEKLINCRQSLDSISIQLDNKLFFKIHRSSIINITKVTKYNKKEVYINNEILPISRNFTDDFEKRMLNIDF